MMDTLRYYKTAEGEHSAHGGRLEFMGYSTHQWSDSPAPAATAVRACCTCGWVGPGFPWGTGHPTDYQRDVLMVPWDQHVIKVEDAPTVRVGDTEPEGMVLAGWVRFDHDEFHDFRYMTRGDRGRPCWPYPGFLPVYAFDPEDRGESMTTERTDDA